MRLRFPRSLRRAGTRPARSAPFTACHFRISLLLLFLLVGSVVIVTGPAHPDGTRAAEAEAATATDAVDPHEVGRAMSRRIDELLQARWRDEGIAPVAASSDAEFLRRMYLDLTGTIPPVSEVRRFLSDSDPEKRSQWIDRLLHSPAHASHLAATWRTIMLPQGFDASDLNTAIGLQKWLRDQFAANLRYDNLVAEFLVATGTAESGPALYYTSLELAPEKLAASTARIFLGLQIQCAQCHDHPFDRWTQRDFWGYAAFFAQLNRGDSERPLSNVSLSDAERGEVMIPNSNEVVPPKFPGGRHVDSEEAGTRRQQLAIWTASRDNPYLSHAAVNWAWAHLFGRGLVNPVDDLGPHNPPSHPEVMDELATYFERSGFDLRNLLRVLANTEAYQLTSRMEAGQSERLPSLFARMTVKTMTPDQLYDSLTINLSERRMERSMRSAASPLMDPQRRAFIARVQSPARDATEYAAGLPQALMLMNGPEMEQATSMTSSNLLRGMKAPFFTNQQRIEILFLATLSRFPTDQERQQFQAYVEARPESPDQAFGDVLWALLNSAEFTLVP